MQLLESLPAWFPSASDQQTRGILLSRLIELGRLSTKLDWILFLRSNLALKFFSNELYQVFDLLRSRFVFERRHAVAAIADLIGVIFVRVFDCFPFSQTGDLQLQVVNLYSSAFPLRAIQPSHFDARIARVGAQRSTGEGLVEEVLVVLVFVLSQATVLKTKRVVIPSIRIFIFI